MTDTETGAQRVHTTCSGLWTLRARGRVGNFPPFGTLQEALPTWSATSEQPETTQRDSWPFGSELTSSAALKQKLEAHSPGMLQRHFLHLVPSTSRVCDSMRLRFGVLQPSALPCPYWSCPDIWQHIGQRSVESVYKHSHREKSSCVISPRLESGSQVVLIFPYTLLYFQIFYNDHCYFDNQGKISPLPKIICNYKRLQKAGAPGSAEMDKLWGGTGRHRISKSRPCCFLTLCALGKSFNLSRPHFIIDKELWCFLHNFSGFLKESNQ